MRLSRGDHLVVLLGDGRTLVQAAKQARMRVDDASIEAQRRGWPDRAAMRAEARRIIDRQRAGEKTGDEIMNATTCWACEREAVGSRQVLAEVKQVKPSVTGGSVVEGYLQRVTVCLPCAAEARARALRPMLDAGVPYSERMRDQ